MTASVITSGSWRFRRREFPGSHLRSWADELDRSAGFPCAYRDFLQVCLEAALVQRALEELDGIERLDITLATPAGFV
jgi:hypothetical protein